MFYNNLIILWKPHLIIIIIIIIIKIEKIIIIIIIIIIIMFFLFSVSNTQNARVALIYWNYLTGTLEWIGDLVIAE